MWKVYCDDHLIHSSEIESLKIFNTKLELELNKTGSFTFTIYPSNPYYSKLEKLKSIIKVYCDNYLMFKGRILNDTSLFYNQKEIICEGELAFLIDSVQRPYDFQSGENHTNVENLFTFFIENHNSQVEEEKQFKVGNVTVKDPNDYIVRSDTTYLTTWESLNQKLIETHGGYLWVRHEEDGNYIDYLEDFNVLSNQTIEFGKNLLDFNKIAKGETIATAIIPVGSEGLTISEVNNGVDYVYNEEAVKKYGWIFKKVEWEDVTIASNLMKKANEYLSDVINLVISIELSAVDLASLNKDFNSFRLGTYVSVKSNPHGVDSKFLVTKLSIDLLSPSKNKLTLGKSYLTFTEKVNSNNNAQKIVINNISKEGVTTAQLNAAVYDTSQQMSSSLTQTEEELLSKVSEDYYLKSDAEKLVESISTQFTQTNEYFEMQFNKFHVDIEDVVKGVDANFQEIKKYIRFVDGNIILGEEGNEITLRIENDRISFLQDNVEVAYFSNKKLYVLDGEFINSLKLGKFAFVPRSTGNLSFKKIE